MTGVLYAKVGGAWVPINSGGGGGTDEVWVGNDDPIATAPTIELWYDPDAASTALEQAQAWNAAWGVVARATMSGSVSVTSSRTQVAGVDFAPVPGRRYRFTLNVRSLQGGAAMQFHLRKGGTDISGNTDRIGPGSGVYAGTLLQWAFNADVLGAPTSGNFNVSAFLSAGAGPNILYVDIDTSFFTIEDVGPISTFIPPLDPTPAWIPVPYTNGWTNIGGTLAAGAYRKVGDMVHLRGYSLPGTAVGVFTLPVGYRPPANLEIACSGYNGTSRIINSLTIKTDGVCSADQLFGFGYNIQFSVTP